MNIIAEINYKFIYLKKQNNMFNKIGLLIIIILSVLIFSPALGNFFWGDDWFLIEVSRIDSSREFIDFFSFTQTSRSVPFYRPVSTNLFFYTFQTLFGLNIFFYRLFALILFGVSLYLVYKFSEIIFQNKVEQNLTLFIYGISAIHFNTIYYLSAIADSFMVVFVICSILFFFKLQTTKNLILSLFFFILALGSKETAVVTPLLILVIIWFKKQKSFIKIIWFFPPLFLYLLLHLMNPSIAVENSYIFDFSPIKLLNTLFWYVAWSFGAPELLVDYIGNGFKILPRFYDDFHVWSWVILGEVTILFTSLCILIFNSKKKMLRRIVLGSALFIISLLPVIFFPWHKFAYYLTLPLLGFSIALAELIDFNKKFISCIFIAFFIILNISSVILNYQTNYSVSRSRISERVFLYFQKYYPVPPKDSYFEFINDTPVVNQYWGSSKQIDQAISQSNLFKVLYKNHDYLVFYEDINAQRPVGKNKIPVSTAKFLTE